MVVHNQVLLEITAFLTSALSGVGMMMAEKNAELRRKSMELLKELTEILQRIIGSGDEQSLMRLQETISALRKSRRDDKLH
jgi:hypothetical protein